MGQLSNLSLLVKPASALCNMRCRYCFYAEEAARREQAVSGMMAEETARGLIDAAIEAVSGHGEITFAFQGGEPTLAGLDFFLRFCAYAEEHASGNHRLHWSIQTNGLRLDPEWAEFLREHRFLAGVSLDGTEALHDAFRPDAEGKAEDEITIRTGFRREGYFSIEDTANDLLENPDARKILEAYIPGLVKVMTEQNVIPLGLTLKSILSHDPDESLDAAELNKELNQIPNE